MMTSNSSKNKKGLFVERNKEVERIVLKKSILS